MTSLAVLLKALVMSALFVMTHHGHAASFDCKKAKSKREILVCASPELNALDEKLGAVYTLALRSHPMPSYVKARQRLWLKEEADTAVCFSSKNCDPQSLKNAYEWRIRLLENASSHMVYTPTGASTFSYDDGDTVVEVWRESPSVWNVYLFGGAVMHRLASQENKKLVMTNCEFDGQTPNIKAGVATSGDISIKFRMTENIFDLAAESTNAVCTGFASVGRSFTRVR